MARAGRKARSALIEKAVKAAQVYIGCEGQVRVRDEQKLYTQMRKAITRVADHYAIAEHDAAHQVTEEAKRRGPICPIPGKDV
jgi:hypothetical protein